MKISKIVLCNFNSFEGLNEFDFSNTNKDKNIILIGGKNGAGKTSLFTAVKTALYGPLAFGYVSVNPHYISKIKDCINSKTFQTDKVESKVQITISLMVEREMKEYEITRKWNYSKQRLTEEYYVKVGDKVLDEQEQSYFQNYLQSLVPPDLFEFFLFDGEEVGSIFATSAYNTYVRNAVYTLCRLDIFEIIRKYTKGYVGKAATEDESQLFAKYDLLRESVENLERENEKINVGVAKKEKEFEQIETELLELGVAFKNAGGITEKERRKLNQELQETEQVKMESTTRIKFFVEDIMPFYIIREFTDKVSNQLEYEEKGEIFYYVQQKLDRKDIQNALPGDVSKDSVDRLMDMLLAKFRPKGFSESAEPMYDLSKEDTGRVNAMIATIENFDKDAMVSIIKKKLAASSRTGEINKILKSAMADEDAAEFIEKENELLKKKDEIAKLINAEKAKQEQVAKELESMRQQRDRAWQSVKENAQNKHVFELSMGLTSMMDSLLGQKTIEIKKELEHLIVDNLKNIYRKNNLITHIEIDADFQFNLYQNAKYTAVELMHLLKNIGKENFSVRIGRQGQEILFRKYGVTTINELQQALLYDATSTFELYKNIDLNRLSKGERQIFILSLYWAIIKLSGQDIPFIIDTPYARIDANHRRVISEKFFPNISKQVIILSTDEEVNEEYYEIIKPFVAKEYLLINDENQNRTSIENHYFFGERV